MPKPNDVGVGTSLIVFNHAHEVLLLKRKGSHASGTWGAPGGWLERSDDSTTDAAIRELKEEMGLVVKPENVYRLSWTTQDHPEAGIRSVTLSNCTLYTGSQQPAILEPDKCEEIGWFKLDKLPSPIFPNLIEVIAEASALLKAFQKCLSDRDLKNYMSTRGL